MKSYTPPRPAIANNLVAKHLRRTGSGVHGKPWKSLRRKLKCDDLHQGEEASARIRPH
jgi:hypothetical protein